MKKNIYFTLALGAVLLLEISAFAKTPTQEALSRQVTQKIEQTADNAQQVTSFMKNLAQKDPAKLANFLLGGKFAYVYNESIVYLGVQSTGDVLVICQINDSDVGTFYYIAHKKGNRVFEDSVSSRPDTQAFVTLFERK